MHLYQKCLISSAMLASTIALLVGARDALYEWRTRRRDVIDRLESPRTVVGWNVAGLTLEDGSSLPLPNIETLPAQSHLLEQLVRSGVEVDRRDGRVYGLLSVWPTCGNDPVRVHVTRTDMGRILEFVQDKSEDGGSRFTDSRNDGWSESQYYWYERWLAKAN